MKETEEQKKARLTRETKTVKEKIVKESDDVKKARLENNNKKVAQMQMKETEEQESEINEGEEEI